MPPLPLPSPLPSLLKCRPLPPAAMASIADGTSASTASEAARPGSKLRDSAAAEIEVKGCDYCAVLLRQRRASIDVFRRPTGTASNARLRRAHGGARDVVTFSCTFPESAQLRIKHGEATSPLFATTAKSPSGWDRAVTRTRAAAGATTRSRLRDPWIPRGSSMANPSAPSPMGCANVA